MRKLLILSFIVFSALVSSNAYAQETREVSTIPFKVGDNRVSVGIGSPSVTLGMKVPPVSATYERGVFSANNMIFGVGASYETSVSKDDVTCSSLMGIGKVHVPFSERLEASAYLGFGYGSEAILNAKMNSVISTYGLEVVYCLNDTFGVFADYHFTTYLSGASRLRVGVSFNF